MISGSFNQYRAFHHGVAIAQRRRLYSFFRRKHWNLYGSHQKLVAVYGGPSTSYVMVCKWRNQFLNGREHMHDGKRSGRPSYSIGEMLLQLMLLHWKIVEEDPLGCIKKKNESRKCSVPHAAINAT